MSDVLEVLSPGTGLALQDMGRPGWKRHGLPPGGAMDADSAAQANLLVGNPAGAPVLELTYTGARLRVLQRCELALAGADVACSHPLWRSLFAEAGEEIVFTDLRSGVWTYLAVQGGWAAPEWFGSASVNPRAGLGRMLTPGIRLAAQPGPRTTAISGRFVSEQPHWEESPTLPVWPGPEWEKFSQETRSRFLRQSWRVSTQSDRSGYRLEGEALEATGLQIPSSPTAVGVIQVPAGGQPIVLLRDGPTVGGYPRLAILDPSAVSRFTQCAPGTSVQFQLVE